MSLSYAFSQLLKALPRVLDTQSITFLMIPERACFALAAPFISFSFALDTLESATSSAFILGIPASSVVVSASITMYDSCTSEPYSFSIYDSSYI